MSARVEQTWADVVFVVGSREAVRVWTDPLAAAVVLDGDQLSVLAVERRRWTQFLRTE